MRFGVFYELQLPRPWAEHDEHRLFKEAIDQVALADRLGIDYAWEVEHHFLEEYSHSSAPEVFLSHAAALTENIRLGHGIRQVIPNYNHPARTAEGLATLDLLSNGRVDFGIGEGATRLRHVRWPGSAPVLAQVAVALGRIDVKVEAQAGEEIGRARPVLPGPGPAEKTLDYPDRNAKAHNHGSPVSPRARRP